MKRRWNVLIMIILTMALLGGCGAAPQEQSEAEKTAQQWETLSEAYRYVFPLVLMNQSMAVATNTEEPDLNGHAPVNQLIHAQNLVTADFKMVVTPNVDTVYTQAWLDLEKEPMVYVKPDADRFFQVQVLDAWTDTPAVLVDTGTYLFTTEDWQGDVPEGMTQIKVSTDMVWLLGRVLVNSEADMPNVRAIQNGMRLLPLSAYEAGGTYTPPTGEYKEENNVEPLKSVLEMDPQTFFNTANQLMLENPPASEDEDVLKRFSELNVGPGMTFDVGILLGDVKTEWTSMLQDLRKILGSTGAEYQVALGQWKYYGEPIGNYGTAYDYRAMIALGGLGANPVEVAIYPKTDVDDTGEQLNGSHVYQLHFDTLPPILDGGFWSVTAYGSDDYLIANEIDRYCINDRSDFTQNADGSVDLILAAAAPENTANWLPTGTDDFHLFMRIYLPDVDAIQGGWKAPAITKIK